MRQQSQLFLLLAASLLIFACAGKTASELPRIKTFAEARAALGAPGASTERPDGLLAHEWVLDQSEFVPGQYVIQQIYIGHDRDGYRKYHEREVWVPAHRSGKYCRIVMLADAAGQVLNSTYEGNACDALFK